MFFLSSVLVPDFLVSMEPSGILPKSEVQALPAPLAPAEPLLSKVNSGAEVDLAGEDDAGPAPDQTMLEADANFSGAAPRAKRARADRSRDEGEEDDLPSDGDTDSLGDSDGDGAEAAAQLAALQRGLPLLLPQEAQPGHHPHGRGLIAGASPCEKLSAHPLKQHVSFVPMA